MDGPHLAHVSCCRSLFGLEVIPTIDLALDDVVLEAQRSAGALSLSGVQPKLSIVQKGEKLVSVHAGGRYLLTPQTRVFSPF